MHIHLNGQPRELAAPLSVAALLVDLELHRVPCAVEVNKRLVPKRDHEKTTLADGDHIEVVTLVGGG